jgi:hypothetical protein
MKEHGGHDYLRDSDHQSIISYVRGRIRVILLCVLFNSRVELT